MLCGGQRCSEVRAVFLVIRSGVKPVCVGSEVKRCDVRRLDSFYRGQGRGGCLVVFNQRRRSRRRRRRRRSCVD